MGTYDYAPLRGWTCEFDLSDRDDDLVRRLVGAQRLQCLAVLLQGEPVGDDPLRPGAAGGQDGEGLGEGVDLREGALHGDLAAEDVVGETSTRSLSSQTP